MSTWAAWPFVEENEATLVEIKSSFPAPTEPHHDSTDEAILALAAACLGAICDLACGSAGSRSHPQFHQTWRNAGIAMIHRSFQAGPVQKR